MGKSLITGGLGFVGSFLARLLLKQGEEVVLFDVMSESKRIADIKDKVKVVQGNLNCWQQVLDVVKDNKIDTIYHLAVVMVDVGEASPPIAFDINVNGTLYLMEASRLFDVSSFIFTSTISTYGGSAPPVVNEETAQIDTNMYGVTKICCERLGEYYHRRYGLNFRSVRYPLLIGPGRTTGISRYSSVMIQQAALGNPHKTYVDEDVKMASLYIKDAAGCLIDIKNADEAGLKRRVYNLSGFSVPAGEIATAIKKYMPDAKIEFEPDEPVVKLLNDMSREFDDTKARQEWGFRPKYGLDETVKDFIKEIQDNRDFYK